MIKSESDKSELTYLNSVVDLLFIGKFHSQLNDIIKKVAERAVMKRNRIVDCIIRGLVILLPIFPIPSYLKVYMTRNFLSPSWKDLLKQYNNFFYSFSFSFF